MLKYSCSDIIGGICFGSFIVWWYVSPGVSMAVLGSMLIREAIKDSENESFHETNDDSTANR